MLEQCGSCEDSASYQNKQWPSAVIRNGCIVKHEAGWCGRWIGIVCRRWSCKNVFIFCSAADLDVLCSVMKTQRQMEPCITSSDWNLVTEVLFDGGLHRTQSLSGGLS